MNWFEIHCKLIIENSLKLSVIFSQRYSSAKENFIFRFNFKKKVCVHGWKYESKHEWGNLKQYFYEIFATCEVVNWWKIAKDSLIDSVLRLTIDDSFPFIFPRVVSPSSGELTTSLFYLTTAHTELSKYSGEITQRDVLKFLTTCKETTEYKLYKVNLPFIYRDVRV